MRILGIDPGTAIVGWAVIEKTGPNIVLQGSGAITTPKENSDELRLVAIYTQLVDVISDFRPDEVAIEQLFFATNAKTAITVAQARGVILLTCAQKLLPVTSYSPLAIKKTITGDGKADKKQIQYMLSKTLKNTVLPKLDDVTDAIAIALTHAYTHRYKQ